MKDLEIIINEVSEYYNVSKENLYSRNRKREYSKARQVVMFFAKRLTPHSLIAIGRDTFLLNHSTVIYSIKVINDLLSYDKQLQKDINYLDTELSSRLNKRNYIVYKNGYSITYHYSQRILL